MHFKKFDGQKTLPEEASSAEVEEASVCKAREQGCSNMSTTILGVILLPLLCGQCDH